MINISCVSCGREKYLNALIELRLNWKLLFFIIVHVKVFFTSVSCMKFDQIIYVHACVWWWWKEMKVKNLQKMRKYFSSREFKWELFVHVFIKTYHVTYLKPVLCTTNTKNNPKKLCKRNPVDKKCAARIISRYMRICEKGSLKMETEPT